MENSCVTCKWSLFYMSTKHKKPRFLADVAGKCLWPIPPPPPLPLSLKPGALYKIGIWPDYHSCPVWEPKDTNNAE